MTGMKANNRLISLVGSLYSDDKGLVFYPKEWLVFPPTKIIQRLRIALNQGISSEPQ